MSEVKSKEKTLKQDGFVLDDGTFIKYGTPGYTFELRWHDELKKDYLVVTNVTLTKDIMNARAKGTTIYEIIDQFGGIDEVSAAFAHKESDAVYADVSDVPEFADDSAYNKVLEDLAKQVAALQQKQASTEQTEKQTVQKEEDK